MSTPDFTTQIPRERKITRSLLRYVEEGLAARGYDVEVLPSFPHARLATELVKTHVAGGFNFDEGGRPLEMGSSLIERVYTVEFFTFGTTAEYGEAVGQEVRAIAEDEDMLLPLWDMGASADPPVIDHLFLDYARVERIAVRDPRPWEENLWLTRLRVRDEYYGALD